MTLLPRNDPERCLRLALRSMLILGIGLTVLSCYVLLRLANQILTLGFGWNVFRVSTITTAVYLVPGIVYLICWYYLGQHRKGAAMLALVVASLHFLMALVAACSILASTQLRLDDIALGDTVDHIEPILIDFRILRSPFRFETVRLVIFAIYLAAFGQMIYHLLRSLKLWRREARGFEPVMPPLTSRQDPS